ncbi:MAG: D-isomer specific 2-hydroxyacid dehydrogenase family protein [Oscillospiraceae bacterium]|nr:D-isomer specific 2-hydroxyacid dehydrogenase family protein [Oscillospiraceae bacterium]
MKVFVYSCRKFDEEALFYRFAEQYGIELGICREAPTLENAGLARGASYLSIITSKIERPLMERFASMGIRMISTRTVGYDHIDLEAAKEFGVGVSNATYTPECVADYTIMLMLMAIRKMKRIMQRAAINDFTLQGIQGRLLSSFTVGVLGTGKIGRQVIKNLSGFGCRVLAYDLFESDEVRSYAEYTDLETIYRECDLITLHMPLTPENDHMINRDSIARMRDGVVIINTARGGLIDSQALIEGLESGKVGAAGLDVVEKEFGMYYYDRKSDLLGNRELSILRDLPNVVVTPHMAFYTDQSISDMVGHSLLSCRLTEDGKENPWKIL